MNPYEEAVKWIEEEVRKNGVFEIHRSEIMVDYDGTQVYRSCPTGKIRGFTMSSQHTHYPCDGQGDYNLLQLIDTMKKMSRERETLE